MKYHLLTLCHSLNPAEHPSVRAWFGSLRKHDPQNQVYVHALTGPDMRAEMFAPFRAVECIPILGATQVQRVDDPLRWLETVAEMDGVEHLIDDDDWCMTIDLRDVIFQGFPFAPEILSFPFAVNVFQEACNYWAGTEWANSQWLNQLHDGKVPREVFCNPPVCFGIQAAKWPLLKRHFQGLRDQMRTRQTFYGHDQSLLTTLARTTTGYHVHTNEDGPVMHCALQKPYLTEYEGQLLALTTHLRKPAIVHQYDRPNPDFYPTPYRLMDWALETYANQSATP